MDRRDFIEKGLLATAAFSGSTMREAACADDSAGRPLTAQDVQNHLRAFGTSWVDPKRTVDTFKAGDPKMEIKGIAVGWMSYFESLRRAQQAGCNLFITHEPTYYNHLDRDQSVFAFEVARRKKAFLEQSGMAVLRCHDVWDRVPEIGIRDAWARFLDLGKEIDARINSDRAAGRPFCAAYEIEPVRAGDFAAATAARLAPLGQDAVLLVGPEDKIVRSVAIGTGAITPLRPMVAELKADLAVCSDDGLSFWRDGSLAIDMEYPVVVVNHACTEEIGLKRLAEHLSEKFPQVPVRHIAQKCMFRQVGPKT